MEHPCVYSNDGCPTTTTPSSDTTGNTATSSAPSNTRNIAVSPDWNYTANDYLQATAAYEQLIGRTLPKGSANTVRLSGNQISFTYVSYMGSRSTFTLQSDGTYNANTACNSSDSTCRDESESGRISAQAARVLFVSAGATGITLSAGEQATLAQFQGALATARGEDRENAYYTGGCY